MRTTLLMCLFVAAACSTARSGGGDTGHSTLGSGSSGGTGIPGESTSSNGGGLSDGGASGGTSAGSSMAGLTGGSSGGTTCLETPHCVGGYFWTVDCNGNVDGGQCPGSSQCNATKTACVMGRQPSCATDADCVCQEVCGAAGVCVPGSTPQNPCASDLDCGPACEGLTCVDGGCESLTCGTIPCAPGCFCNGFDDCYCPPLPDAGPTCSSYFEVDCNWNPCTPAADGGCGCPPGTGVLDPDGRCVPCQQDSDCDGGFHCDLDPNSFTSYEACVQCLDSSQCAAGTVCDTSQNLCVPDCRLGGPERGVPGGLCDAGCSANGVCGQCVSDADCNAGSVCVGWPDGGPDYGLPATCRLRCGGDAGCSSLHPVCDPTVGYCVDCMQPTDCEACDPPRGPCMNGYCLTGVACY